MKKKFKKLAAFSLILMLGIGIFSGLGFSSLKSSASGTNNDPIYKYIPIQPGDSLYYKTIVVTDDIDSRINAAVITFENSAFQLQWSSGATEFTLMAGPGSMSSTNGVMVFPYTNWDEVGYTGKVEGLDGSITMDPEDPNYTETKYNLLNNFFFIRQIVIPAPAVTINASGLATWAAVENATGYVYKINDAAPVETTTRSVQLKDGESIQVKAVSDTAEDSAYSAAVKYTAPKQLAAPKVYISKKGVANWEAVPGALGYAYKVNNGPTELITDLTKLQVQLEKDDTIIVKAIGDGELSLDSDYTAEKTYKISAWKEWQDKTEDFITRYITWFVIGGVIALIAIGWALVSFITGKLK